MIDGGSAVTIPQAGIPSNFSDGVLDGARRNDASSASESERRRQIGR